MNNINSHLIFVCVTFVTDNIDKHFHEFSMQQRDIKYCMYGEAKALGKKVALKQNFGGLVDNL